MKTSVRHYSRKSATRSVKKVSLKPLKTAIPSKYPMLKPPIPYNMITMDPGHLVFSPKSGDIIYMVLKKTKNGYNRDFITTKKRQAIRVGEYLLQIEEHAIVQAWVCTSNNKLIWLRFVRYLPISIVPPPP